LAAVCRIGGFVGLVIWREWTRMLGQVDAEQSVTGTTGRGGPKKTWEEVIRIEYDDMMTG